MSETRTSYPKANGFETVRKMLDEDIKAIINDPDIQYDHVQNIVGALISIETLLNNLLEHVHLLEHTYVTGLNPLSSPPVYRGSAPTTIKEEGQ